MVIIDIEQGSDAWLALRRKSISATDASVIAGENPYKTVRQLYDEKMQLVPSQSMNDAMRRGQLLEPDARRLLEEELGYNFTPTVIRHPKHSWAIASLDGLSDCKTVGLEIKCPGLASHEEARKGIIKTMYQYQMLWQMFCMGLDKCIYSTYFPGHVQPLTVLTFYLDANKSKKLFEDCSDFYFNNLLSWCPPWKLNMRSS